MHFCFIWICHGVIFTKIFAVFPRTTLDYWNVSHFISKHNYIIVFSFCELLIGFVYNFYLSVVCVLMNFPRLLLDLMKSCIFCKICSFTLHILHWITFYCQKTAYDQLLDFKRCGNDRPGGPLAKLAGMFWDHFNKRSVAREGFGLVSFCFLMQSPDCRGDRMFSFLSVYVTWVIDTFSDVLITIQCCI